MRAAEIDAMAAAGGIPSGHQGSPNRWEPVRFDRSGPVPVWAGTKPVQIQNLNLNSKK